MQAALIESIKKNCRKCTGYRYLKAGDTSIRNAVVADLKRLEGEYTQEFERLRRKDSTTGEEVARAKRNKYASLDLIGTCQKCNREVDLVRRELNERLEI